MIKNQEVVLKTHRFRCASSLVWLEPQLNIIYISEDEDPEKAFEIQTLF